MLAKKETFEVRTVTQKRRERETDERLAHRRVKELHEINDEMNEFGKRIPEKEK